MPPGATLQTSFSSTPGTLTVAVQPVKSRPLKSVTELFSAASPKSASAEARTTITERESRFTVVVLWSKY
jgi:hypothetical protein